MRGRHAAGAAAALPQQATSAPRPAAGDDYDYHSSDKYAWRKGPLERRGLWQRALRSLPQLSSLLRFVGALALVLVVLGTGGVRTPAAFRRRPVPDAGAGVATWREDAEDARASDEGEVMNVASREVALDDAYDPDDKAGSGAPSGHDPDEDAFATPWSADADAEGGLSAMRLMPKTLKMQELTSVVRRSKPASAFTEGCRELAAGRTLTTDGQVHEPQLGAFASLGFAGRSNATFRYLSDPHVAALPLPSAERGVVLVAAFTAATISEGAAKLLPRHVFARGRQQQAVYLSFSTSFGRAWSEPEKLRTHSTGAAWTPKLVYDNNAKRLIVFYAESLVCLRRGQLYASVLNQARDGLGGDIASVIGDNNEGESGTDSAGEGPLDPEAELAEAVEDEWEPGGDIRSVHTAWPCRGSGDTLASMCRWSSPALVLPQKDNAPPLQLSGRPVIMAEGAHWVLPVWGEWTNRAGIYHRSCVNRTAAAFKLSHAAVLVSTDRGRTWTERGFVADPRMRVTSPAVIEVPQVKAARKMVSFGRLMMVVSSSLGCLFRTHSHDLGETWGNLKPLGICNPTSPVDLWRIASVSSKSNDDDDRSIERSLVILAYNNQRASGPSAMKREKSGKIGGLGEDQESSRCHRCKVRLSLAISTDGGYHFSQVAHLDPEVMDGMHAVAPSLLYVPAQLDNSTKRGKGVAKGSGARLVVAYSHYYTRSRLGSRGSRQGIRALDSDIDALMALPQLDVHRVTSLLNTHAMRLAIDRFLSREGATGLHRWNRTAWDYIRVRLANAYSLYEDQPIELEVTTPGAAPVKKTTTTTTRRVIDLDAVPDELGGFGTHTGMMQQQADLEELHRYFVEKLSETVEEREMLGLIVPAGGADAKAQRRRHRDQDANEDGGGVALGGGLIAGGSGVTQSRVEGAASCAPMPCCSTYGEQCVNLIRCGEGCADVPCCTGDDA